MAQDKLQLIPLGGLGEFGMNCLALRWQDEIIVIDAGLMFPEEELLGVDIVVPDITYLIENRSMVKAIVLTHGHEDHIGGLPWILSELNVPVYGTEFTLAYVEGKLDEHGLLDDADMIEILPGKPLHPRRILHHADPRHPLARRLRRARHPHTRGRRAAYRRLQDRSLLARQQALRSAGLRRTRQAGRPLPAAGLHQRRPPRLHTQRKGRASAPRRDIRADQEEALLQLLLFIDPPHPHRTRARAQARPQGRHHGPLDGQRHRDRAGPRLPRRTQRPHHQSQPDPRLPRQQALPHDQRHPGRAHVRALPRRGEQSQACPHRRRRHRAA